ncbi:MAG: SIR2 family protein [Bacteroidetes bacterium]|nr:SIR2 family protein [Bacteroidota bacterium]
MYSTDHVVCIVGAGASTIAGIPMVNDFIHAMPAALEWARQRGLNTAADSVSSVLQKRRGAASGGYRTNLDLDNIEHLFSYLSMKVEETTDLNHAICATIMYAQEVHKSNKVYVNRNALVKGPLYDRLDNDPTLSEAEVWLAALIGIDGLTEVNWTCDLVTLNYDTVIEEALAGLGKSVNYNASYLSIDSLRASVFNNNPSAVNVFKLHGSSNWALPGKQGKNVTVFQNYETIQTMNLTPEIVPPVWNKEANGVLSSVWGNAMKSLEKASHIVVFGYSFPETDQHMKYLLSAGLEQNIRLRSVSVLDPYPTGVVERVEKFLNVNRLSNKSLEVIPLEMSVFCRNPWLCNEARHFLSNRTGLSIA